MSDANRSEQLRDDTLATLRIASKMIDALTASLQTVIDQQRDEIEDLRQYVTELEACLDCLGLDAPRVRPVKVASFNRLRSSINR